MIRSSPAITQILRAVHDELPTWTVCDSVDPVAAQQRPHAGQELLRIERLHHVVIRAQVQPFHLLGRLPLGGEHEDGEIEVLLEHAAHFPAVHLRHHDVQHRQVHLRAFQHPKGRRAVGGLHHVEAGARQEVAHQLADVGIVVDDQYPGHDAILHRVLRHLVNPRHRGLFLPP